MDSPSLPLTLSRSMGRSFRNSSKSSPTLLFPNSLSAGSSYNASRQTSSSRYLPLPKDEFCDSSASPSEINYTVHMPGSPEQRTMLAAQHHDDSDSINASNVVDVDITMTAEQQVVSDAMFTGGYNCTKGWILHKMIDGDATSHPQLAHTSDFICSVHGCDGKVMRDAHDAKFFPCECQYPICTDCYIDRIKDGGICPGCREVYKPMDEEGGPILSLPGPIEPQMERGLSLVRPTRSQILMSTKNFDFDYAHWLYETKGTYGYGNALKSQASFFDGEENSRCMCEEFEERISRPLVRENKIGPTIISPYRLMVLIRVVSLFFFLTWRIRNPNRKAMWLWSMSVVCEVWFALSWILDQMPKLMPINRSADLEALKETFERPSPSNPEGHSDLPGIDFFVSTADSHKEPPLITANSILSILAVDYPVEKVACYLSDDGGALYMFEALAEAASYARLWVPFCRKHSIEPRNPESYFGATGDATKNKIRKDFVKDRRRVKREYDEFKVRINSLPDIIRRRSDASNACEEVKAKRAQIERGADLLEKLDIPKATWMADGNHWPGTWATPVKDHCQGDHTGIIQVMLKPPKAEPLVGESENDCLLDLTDVDIRLPMLVYVSREKRPGYDHNKKAGAMNALMRASAIMSNAPFILNLDCDHYIYNSQAVREGMCFMLGVGGENVCFVQFPQRFEGIDPNDRYANHNTVFFDGNMRALDGVQGPMYVGTGCIFRRTALYGFNPPKAQGNCGECCFCCDGQSSGIIDDVNSEIADLQVLVPTNFGGSEVLLTSIPIADLQGRPLAAGVRYGRPAGLLRCESKLLSPTMVAEAISVISCWYEDKTEWGSSIGWIYGSITEDIVTGYCMHNRGWRSIYCITKQDAFRGTAPVNLTDRLYQVLRWATGSIEIFFSHNNGLLAGPRMKLLQRIAYVNIGIYPFTSLFLLVYCFLPALSLFSNQFIVEQVDAIFLLYLLVMTGTLFLLAILEVKWAGITLEEWWRNEQFWVIGGTSAHLFAVMQGLLKVVAGIDISFSITSKSSSEECTDEFEDLYVIKWTSLMIPPLTIMLVNLIAIAVAVARSLYSSKPDWNKLLGGTFFSMWVLLHLYPFAKGFMGRRGRTPTIIWVWAGLLATIISLLWVAISSPSSTMSTGFQL